MARTRKAQLFERDIKVAFAGVLPPEFQKLHAKLARDVKAVVLKDFKTPPKVETFVDGRKGAIEESVKAYGLIRYEFSRLTEIGAFMLEQAQLLSPVSSGAYKKSWFLMADGKRVAEIPEDSAQIVLTNDVPYHRKLEVTVNVRRLRVNRPPGIVEEVRRRVLQTYGQSVKVEVAFIDLDNPYILKRGSMDKKGRKRGDRMTYPAVIVTL